MIAKQLRYVVEAILRVHDPDAAAGVRVDLLRREPRDGAFLLARLALGIGAGVEGQEGLAIRQPVADFGGDGFVAGDAGPVAPGSDSGAGERVQQLSPASQFFCISAIEAADIENAIDAILPEKLAQQALVSSRRGVPTDAQTRMGEHCLHEIKSIRFQ